MKRRLTTLLISLLCATLSTLANDGSYYASGNILFPLQETSISVRSEILTITICDDGYASIDVQYTFYNDGPAKTIDMAFESPLPYNTEDSFSYVGKHPYIRNFTATLNGKPMSCRSSVVAGYDDTDISNYKTYDRQKWTESEEFCYGDNYIINGNDSVYVTAYAYLFHANFKQGLNTVHHTYKYLASGGFSANFEIPYILQPCTRWANHQVDDFTLRIATPSTSKYFYLKDDVLRQTPFKVISGMGKVRAGNLPSTKYEEAEETEETEETHYQEITLRNGVVECHINNFQPETSLHIISADHLMMQLNNDNPVKDMSTYYNRGWMLLPMAGVSYKEFYGKEPANKAEAEALDRRILRNMPYADRGYVFNDNRLRKYFESLWWYMPDPTWKISTTGFTETDWQFINEYGKK